MSNLRHRHQHQPRYEAIADALELTGASRVLDVGIEPYIFAELLANRSPDHVELFGIAYGNAGETDEIREVTGRSVTVRQCNVETDRWPFEDDSIDRIVLGAILEHLFDPLTALQEARRIITEDGILVLSTPNAVRLLTRIDTLLGTNPFDGLAFESPYNRHNHEWTRTELLDILAIAGFDVTDQRYLTVNRTGIHRLIAFASRVHRSLADQFVFKCRPTEQVSRIPVVYRQGLVEDASLGDER